MIQSSFELYKIFAGELDPDLLQKKFLMSLLKIQNVQRGSIWIKCENGYRCIEAAGAESSAIKGVRIDNKKPSIVGWVIENRKRTVADVRSDARHYRELEENLAVKSSLILCFPLFLNPDEVYGAVQIIDTRTEKADMNIDGVYLNYLQDLVDIGSVALGNALLFKQQGLEKETLENALRELKGNRGGIGHSRSFRECMALVESYAASDFHVLITGESGTGKELVAREIHRRGSRGNKPFLAQNCSAIPDSLLASELFGYKKGAFSGAVRDKIGLFEAAEGGTVFLDEIGDMPLSIQASLLRVLQSNEIKPLGQNLVKHVDVRIIAATNRDLRQMAGTNAFRSDLYYRLSVLPIHLPPLRERRDDIPLLANHFLKQESLVSGTPPKRFDQEALQCLMDWSWPGNIRELENLVKYLMVVTHDPVIGAGSIRLGDDAPGVRHSSVGASAVEDRAPAPSVKAEVVSASFENRTWQDMETLYALHLLDRHGWNIARAAGEAGIHRSTFVSRMRRLGIQRQHAGQRQ